MKTDDSHQPLVNLEIESKLGLGGRLASNTAMLASARIISAIMGVSTLILAAKVLPNNAAFGTLLFIHAYMLFFSEIASFKSWQALIRFGADEVKAKDANRLGSLIKTGLILDFAAAILGFLLSIFLFNVFLWAQANFGTSDDAATTTQTIDAEQLKTWIFYYCTVILFRQVNVSIGIFRLFDKFFILSMRALVMPTIRFVGVIIAGLQGWGLSELICIWFVASVSGYVFLQIFATVEVLRRNLWPAVRNAKFCRSKTFPGLYNFIVKTNIDSTIKAFNSNFPSLAIMLVFGPALLAIYKVAEEISKLLSRGITLFNQVLFPELSRMAADMDLKSLTATTAKAALCIGLLSFAITGAVLLFGQDLAVSLFDNSFTDAPILAVMLLISTSLVGIATPFYALFYAIMKPGAAIQVRIIRTVFFITLFFMLSMSFELYSIGYAAIASAMIETALVIGMATYLTVKLSRQT
ncbi:MAG: lipopolysaccharide biosynthesis protein [Litorimonas sp.]